MPGLAGEYNKTADEDKKLMPGCIIAKVNGDGGSTQMLLEKLKSRSALLWPGEGNMSA